MIVREIKDNPDEVISNFDWFNDYDDTLAWCKHSCPEIGDQLEQGFLGWLAIRNGGNHERAE